ncbi:TPA: thymidine phosphorylase family protein [Legionella pneumophila]|uniref:Putative thymidine phosphorylase n=1 Tax=Legionella pneumophila TaxID=446 RepID=A0AAP3MCV7_LEGPN|nr:MULTISPECIES: thymidine phosphorylase family protein [Legionellaceae]MCZ4692076.1 thymidine phosphorylase family protein [Legionella pneumophila]MCZ4709343.1 thymidine phosphorylase family protein [Legionella pneumophila]MCZ4719595.1 thymidine phosphorylase family protein [Legionella pneumophila]HAT8651878.1 thymidine phosphorylase [Legionella pneumophila]HCE5384953.1 thymidine phosphorylase family protein [Legionella pneumophila]
MHHSFLSANGGFVVSHENSHVLCLKYLGIKTYHEAIIYMREDCHVCHSEGFEVQTRIQVSLGGRSIMATLNVVTSELLKPGEASLSNYAWDSLKAKEGDEIQLSHPKPLESLSFVHTKIYGNELSYEQLKGIVDDVLSGRLSDVQIAAFLAASSAGHLTKNEIMRLTQVMIDSGDRLSWSSPLVMDKHCVGGLPGNRTTLIVVPIVAAFGLIIPKTSSRAITSPAGTADTMETLAPVYLSPKAMRHVVEKENGCIVWGGAVSLSPADDVLIRVERALDLDSEGQLVASILSKKIATGATHAVIDIPVGPTAKVRDKPMALLLKHLLEDVGQQLGLVVHTILTDGSQPVGNGIGPSLEARDVLAVLQGLPDAPNDLRERALKVAGALLELSSKVPEGLGQSVAQQVLDSGQAFKKFQAICEAQGGMKELKTAHFTHPVVASQRGQIALIDNRKLAKIAKLAGAPKSQSAGVDLHVHVGAPVEQGEPLFTIHAESSGELNYACDVLRDKQDVIVLGEHS